MSWRTRVLSSSDFLVDNSSTKSWKVFRLDVKSSLLNCALQEGIYVEQLEGFVEQGEEDKVYLLKEAFYGQKQALEPGTA